MKNKAHVIGADDGYLFYLFVQQLALGTLEAKFDIVGREGIAIVKMQPLAQFELIHSLVRAQRPRFRQTRGQVVARHRLHERIVQGKERPKMA